MAEQASYPIDEPVGRSAARRSRGPRSPSFVPFLLTLLVILSTCWGVVGALFAPVIPGGWRTLLIGALTLTAAPLAMFIASRTAGRYPGALMRLFVFRTFWYAQAMLLLTAPAGMLGILLGLPFGAAAGTGRVLLSSVAGAFVLLMLAGYVGSRRLVITPIEARFPDLPSELDGLRIAQISDVHVGPHTPRRHLRNIVRATEHASPDLIAITGDLVDDHAGDVGPFAAGLGALRAPLGVFAIPGNHDVYAGWAAVRHALDRLPLVTLVNEATILEHQGRRFSLVGTGDPAAARDHRPGSAAPDIGAALARVPDDHFVIALAHNPALWPALAARRVPLTLSGHTHWGQFAIPKLNWSLASGFLDLAMGSYEREGSRLYVHPGSNYWGIPFRLGTPPEVAIITLRRAA